MKTVSLVHTQQRKAESHLIGESLFNYEILTPLKKEDFRYYRKQFEIIQTCKGDQLKIISEYPELYKIQDSIVYVAMATDRLMLFLTENTFKRTLQGALETLNGNAQEISESVLYDELRETIKTQDVFDLMDFLPDYFETVGLPKESIEKWVVYCKGRVKEIKEYLDKK